MNCRTCSNPLPEDAVFCPECGVRVAVREVTHRKATVVGAGGRGPVGGDGEGGSRPAADGDADGGAAPTPASDASSSPGGVRAVIRAGAPRNGEAVPVRQPTPTSPAHASPLPPRASVDALLARANLLRMRGQWAEAVERCTEALRADSHSAAAHSLLGDIYENQGRLDKASHWYQLALEQNPESIADKAKLARVRELQAVRRRTGDPRFSWAYLVAVAGVAFLFVAFVMAAVVAGERNRGVPSAVVDKPTPQFPPSAIPRVQPLDHTDEEEKLANYLIARLGSPYMQVVTVTLNPIERDAFVTTRMTERPIIADPLKGSRRDQLLREGYRIAWLARGQQLERKRDLQYVTVRTLARLSSAGAGSTVNDEVWRGRVQAGRMVLGDDRASVKEVRDVYDWQWWNPLAGF